MRVGACALLVRDGRFLLGHRSPQRAYYPDVWDLIGGHVEPTESPREALVREVREEVGLVPTAFHLVEVATEPDPDTHGPGEFHIFLVTEWSGREPQPTNAEHDELGWFTPAEARALPLADPAYISLFSRVEAILGTPDLRGRTVRSRRRVP